MRFQKSIQALSDPAENSQSFQAWEDVGRGNWGAFPDDRGNDFPSFFYG